VSVRARVRRLAVWLALGALTAACTSPEATRMREGGRGADPGNQRGVVQLHEGADPYWRTPRQLPERQAMSAAGRPREPAASPHETRR